MIGVSKGYIKDIIMNTEHILLHLSLINNVFGGAIKRLLEDPRVSLDMLYTMSSQDFMRYGCVPKQAHLLQVGLADTKLLHHELSLLEKHAIGYITIFDAAYPEHLKHIHQPPLVIYYRGALFNFAKNLAIVGSRKANNYAQNIIDAWVPTCVAHDWAIISGGALGVDAMAHAAALHHGGKTVAVLGSGLLHLYPRSNVTLFEKIIYQGGAVISSFPLTMEAFPHNFPARNRIIAGLSSACLVVQAAKKSGASITAEFALEQGRSVFAVPGSIFDPLHEGCHMLIKEGATLINSVDDLLDQLGEKVVVHVDTSPSKEVNTDIFAQQSLEALSLQDRILLICTKNETSSDEIMHACHMQLDELYDQLFQLQLAGKIEQTAVGLWRSL